MTVGKAATSVGALLHAAHRSCCGRITGGQHVWPAWASRSLGSSRMPVQNYYCQYTHRNRLLSPSSSSSAPSSVRDAATLFKVGVGDRAALRSAAAALLGLPPRRSYMDDGRGRTNDDYRDEVLCWICGKPGHKAVNCRGRKYLREDVHAQHGGGGATRVRAGKRRGQKTDRQWQHEEQQRSKQPAAKAGKSALLASYDEEDDGEDDDAGYYDYDTIDEDDDEEEFDPVAFGFDDDDDDDGDGEDGDFIDVSQLDLDAFTPKELVQLREMIEDSGGSTAAIDLLLGDSGSPPAPKSARVNSIKAVAHAGAENGTLPVPPGLSNDSEGGGSMKYSNLVTNRRRRRPDELCWLCGRPGHDAADCPVPADGSYRRDTETTRPLHLPVMAAEVHQALDVKPGGVYLDATFGAGGHTRAILDVPDTTVVAVDCDPVAITVATDFARETGGRVVVARGRLGSIAATLDAAGIGHGMLDGVLMDVGVSSMQLGDPDRGFSFAASGPLDMRMAGADVQAITAADVVNNARREELEDILYTYTGAGERYYKLIAAAIVNARNKYGPITTTEQLAGIVSLAVRGRPRKLNKTHPATLTFQALRMFVNEELEQLETGIEESLPYLKIGGKLAVITFHSLEAKSTKKVFRRHRPTKHTAPPSDEKEQPEMPIELPLPLPVPAPQDILLRPAVKLAVPSDEEVESNPRCRSAQLRVVERVVA